MKEEGMLGTFNTIKSILRLRYIYGDWKCCRLECYKLKSNLKSFQKKNKSETKVKLKQQQQQKKKI